MKMWRRIRSLIVKELLASVRDRQTRWVVLFSPPLLLIVYAFAITQEVKDIPVAVVNQDAGVEARELISRFEGSPIFSTVDIVDTMADIDRAINARRAVLGVHFGEDFTRNLAAGRQADVQLILDGRRSNTAQIVQGYATEIIYGYNLELARRQSAPIISDVVSRAWFNPNFRPLWYAAPALFAVLTAVVGFMVSTLSVARERELGTFEQLLVSPLHPIEIMIGKTVPAVLIGLASAAAMLAVAWIALGVPFRGSLPLLIGGTTVFLISIVGIGLFISSLAATQQQAVIGLFFYMMPAVLLSGYATPVENMPHWLQWFAETDPIMHFIMICKGVFLKDAPASYIWAHVWPMAVIAVFTLAGGAWLFRKKIG